MGTVLEHFEILSARGLRVIPLRHNSKVPWFRAWNRDWDRDRCREKLRLFPESNIGLLLGDVIDVEGDSPEANELLDRLTAGSEHPRYQSSRSVHHLFVTPDPKLRHFKTGQVEFRGHGHQSVLPPSRAEGVEYRWLGRFQFPIPAMPPTLLEFFRSKQRRRERPPNGCVEASCAGCGEKSHVHRKRLVLEKKAMGYLGLSWKCRGCRPADLRPACRLIRAGVSEALVRKNLACRLG